MATEDLAGAGVELTDGQLRLRPGSKVQVKTTASTAGENET